MKQFDEVASNRSAHNKLRGLVFNLSWPQFIGALTYQISENFLLCGALLILGLIVSIKLELRKIAVGEIGVGVMISIFLIYVSSFMLPISYYFLMHSSFTETSARVFISIVTLLLLIAYFQYIKYFVTTSKKSIP
ncbi:MAG: hypothetical protein COB38_06385 [Gammaproteobacteria bacterium]|nr:MAG: hypothetical protein COB38_06385 [Gammaproteobacteria bacterium]